MASRNRIAADAVSRLRLKTPGTQEYRSWTISLHLCIGLVFTVVIMLLGIILISYSYNRHKDLAFATAGELFDHITQQTAGNISELYAPVEVLVDITASLPLVSTKASEEFDELLDYFTGSLTSSPQLSAIYAGFVDGDFYLVRSVAGITSTGNKLAAPENTAFIVQHIQREKGEPAQYSTRYYDTELHELGNTSGFVTGYDPRTRGWYNQAIRTSKTIVSDFYPFFTTLETGVTIARQVAGGNAVVGADITLKDVSHTLSQDSFTERAEVIVFTESGTVLGYKNADLLESKSLKSGRQVLRAPHINELERQVLDVLFNSFVSGSKNRSLSITVANERWFGSIKPVVFGPHHDNSVFMAIFLPEEELLNDLQSIRLQSAAISLVVLTAALLLAWYLAKRLANLTRRLAFEASKIQHLNFDARNTGRSRIHEIDVLSVTMDEMRSSIRRFADLGKAMTGEQGLHSLAGIAVRETCKACNAGYGGLWLISGDLSELYLIHEQIDGIDNHGSDSHSPLDTTSKKQLETALFRLSLAENDDGTLQAEVYAINKKRSIIIEDVAKQKRFTVTNDQYKSTVLVPLINAEGEVVGLLQLAGLSSQSHPYSPLFNTDKLTHIETLASIITVAVDNQLLMKSHYDTFESLTKVLAVATDAKSAHTGGHCQRVPVLTSMLAEAASASKDPAFHNFKLNPAVRRELHVASWLHDCGKVTTPDHVVDKATKLETVYNRIHEIRTRFEVILRDIHIHFYKTLVEHPDADSTRLRELMEAEVAKLHEDFAFIAECNIGTESMTPERQRRLRHIANRRWTRHFDNTIGLSMKERELQQHESTGTLPTYESLLADKIEHIEPRISINRYWGDNLCDFNMDVPEHEYNHGEIHNLTIEKGTLTAEERFKVNDHIVQTQIMLSSIPFPRELQRVPEIAGNHHEKLDGSGFPRGLTGKQLGIEERIMVIADIFEALTAADRPYKKAKNLSESINIMSDMVEDGFICPDLFNLFLESGVYKQYAVDYLQKSQVDTLDFRLYTRAGNEVNEMEKQDVV